MPAQRAAAVFEPISPELDLAALVEQTPNFNYVHRIPYEEIESQGMDAFEKFVQFHVISGGKPLVIEGYDQLLNKQTFSSQWLRDNVGKKIEEARALEKGEDLPLSINHYLNNMSMLANQWNKYNFREKHRQRLYLKDIDCPQLWHEELKKIIPLELFYLNDSTDVRGGPGTHNKELSHDNGTSEGKGIAKSGDLMSSLPAPMRADNLMCYIGYEGTYTPAHREMCASLGQNIMVEASGTVGENGETTKPGSSIWLMTETKDRHVVSEYWLSALGHDIEVESHFASLSAWEQAPFTVYIVEQKVGDFLLIPPLAPHQVWNRGTRTMKVAWNRTTVDTLEYALQEALPRARMVCRDEQYKTKSIILFTLNKYSRLLNDVERQKNLTRDEKLLYGLKHGTKIKQLCRDFNRLFLLFHEIMLSEMLSPQLPRKRMESLPYDSFVTCSYCRCNIFNRFLTCKSCVFEAEDGDMETYDICMDCYAMGRSCRCISKLVWVEQFPWKDLLEKHKIWREQMKNVEDDSNTITPLPLDDAYDRLSLSKKTLAHICQEQLSKRPFKKPQELQNAESVGSSESDSVNGDGTLKKKSKKKRSEKRLTEHPSCHICTRRDPRWKTAICACGTAYCYGSLWRAFDIMPQTVMEDLDWMCPQCRKICNCSICIKNPSFRPYEPNGTVLGHDTRKFADPRSVESLVDFSFSNIHWLKKTGKDHTMGTQRLDKRRRDAALMKTQTTFSDHELAHKVLQTIEGGDMAIDPQLGGGDSNNGTRQLNQPELVTLSDIEMDANLDRLEQDPDAFMAEGGPNSMDYEYPDPDLSTQFFEREGRDLEEDIEEMARTHSKEGRSIDHLRKDQDDGTSFIDDLNPQFPVQHSQRDLVPRNDIQSKEKRRLSNYYEAEEEASATMFKYRCLSASRTRKSLVSDNALSTEPSKQTDRQRAGQFKSAYTDSLTSKLAARSSISLESGSISKQQSPSLAFTTSTTNSTGIEYSDLLEHGEYSIDSSPKFSVPLWGKDSSLLHKAHDVHPFRQTTSSKPIALNKVPAIQYIPLLSKVGDDPSEFDSIIEPQTPVWKPGSREEEQTSLSRSPATFPKHANTKFNKSSAHNEHPRLNTAMRSRIAKQPIASGMISDEYDAHLGNSSESSDESLLQ